MSEATTSPPFANFFGKDMLKKIRQYSLEKPIRAFLMGALSGIGLILAFPNFHLSYFAFFAFTPLFMVLMYHGAMAVFLATTTFTLVFYFYILSWIRVFHPLALPSLVFAILGFYLIAAVLYRYSRPNTRTGVRSPIYLALCFTALEYTRNIGFIRFPYGSIAYSQYEFLSFIQISEIGGYFAVSFLIYLSNALLAQFLGNFTFFIQRVRDSQGRLAISELFLNRYMAYLLVFTLCLGFGNARIAAIDKIARVADTDTLELDTEAPEDASETPVEPIYDDLGLYSYQPLKVSLVQPWFDYNLPWSTKNKDQLLSKLTNLTVEAAKSDPALIIWPETAILDYYEHRLNQQTPSYSHRFKNFFTEFSKSSSTRFLVGSLALEYADDTPTSPSKTLENQKINSAKDAKTGGVKGKDIYKYNASLFLEANGEIIDYSGKRLLVGFAEYFPYQDMLEKVGFIKRILREAQASSFTPYPSFKVFFDERAVPFGSMICFEDCFPDPSIAMTLSGAKFLVVITNDAWSYSVKSQLLHYSYAVFRAIETRRPLLRVGNAGVTGLVEATGNLKHDLPQFEEGISTFSFRPLTLLSIFSLYGSNVVHVVMIFFLVIYLPQKILARRIWKRVKSLASWLNKKVKQAKKSLFN